MAIARSCPKALQEDLVVERLPDETLVYDLKTHKAHCLSPLTAAVWRSCNGQRTLDEIARSVEAETDQHFDSELVLLALERLEKARLLEPIESLDPLPIRGRREWLKRAAALGGLTVATIAVPTPAMAISCLTGCGDCKNTRTCCPGLSCQQRSATCGTGQGGFGCF